MAWITPKTDWGPTDYFNVDPDWNRIKGNMEYIQAWARHLFRYIDFDPMPEINYTVACTDNTDSIAKTGKPSFPTPTVVNTIEDSIQALMDGTYDLAEFLGSEPRVAGSASWDYVDLNRIESMQLRVKELLDRTDAQRQGIPFKLGGGYFAEGLA